VQAKLGSGQIARLETSITNVARMAIHAQGSYEWADAAGRVTLPSGLPGPSSRLSSLRYGDQIVLRDWGSDYVYRVTDSRVVSPADSAILQHETLPVVTLVTCQGYDERTGRYTHRQLVRAVLVRVQPEWLPQLDR